MKQFFQTESSKASIEAMQEIVKGLDNLCNGKSDFAASYFRAASKLLVEAACYASSAHWYNPPEIKIPE